MKTGFSPFRRFARRALLRGACALLLLCCVSAVAADSALLDDALDFAKKLDPDTDVKACREAFLALTQTARAAIEKNQADNPDAKDDPKSTIEILNKVILIDREVSYISNQYWRDSLFTSALMHKKGNCLSTSLLYFLIGRELKLPLKLIFLPRHAMARWDDGKTVLNIETTDHGRICSNERVMNHFDLSEKDLPGTRFLTDLSDEETHAYLLANWSQVLFSMDRRNEARMIMHQVAQDFPENTEFQLEDGGFALAAGRTEEAEAVFKAVMKKAEAPWARGAAAMTWSHYLEGRGRIDEAMEILQREFETAPARMRLTMVGRLGVLYRHKRDFPKAIKYHKLRAEYDPSEETFNDLGSVLTEAHEDPEAIDAYEKALTFNPESFFTRVILAGLYERSGDKEKGRALFAKIEEPRDGKLEWWCSLVWYYANIKDEPLMLANMKKALDEDGSGHVYQYFVREPDLDSYREHAEFSELMKQHAP